MKTNTHFSKELILEANRKLFRRERLLRPYGTSKLPIEPPQFTMDEIRNAFRQASIKLRTGK
ncbi:hypothetical protein [Rugamonas sp.]|uniref:hypothetical protein n=1 Tax=Rugamonas sp. TaxID=1926287 RepID=UPI0025DE843F|nr:hypothetical protein [Rugamonas sp.]